MKTSEVRDPLGGIWLHKRDEGDESSDDESKEQHSNPIEDFNVTNLQDSAGDDSIDPEKDLIDLNLGNDHKLDESMPVPADSVDSSDIPVDQEFGDKQKDDISVNDLVNELLAVDMPTDLNSSENGSQIEIKNIGENSEQTELIDDTKGNSRSVQSTLLFDPLLEDSGNVKDMDIIPKDDPFSLFYDVQRQDDANTDTDTNINQVKADNDDLESTVKEDISPSNPSTPSDSMNGQEEENKTKMQSASQLKESSRKFEEIDYIYDAAKFIVQAVREESNCNYNESFVLYKEGIRTLLAGAQSKPKCISCYIVLKDYNCSVCLYMRSLQSITNYKIKLIYS